MDKTLKEIKVSENDKLIVKVLKEAGKAMTLAEINEVAGKEIKSGSMTGAIRKGFVAKAGEVDVERKGKRKVSTYVFVTADALKDAKGKDFNYTDGEKAILGVLGNADGAMTLADIAVALGKEKLSSGSINGLVKKGNVRKGDEVTVEVMVSSTVNTYKFVKDAE